MAEARPFRRSVPVPIAMCLFVDVKRCHFIRVGLTKLKYLNFIHHLFGGPFCLASERAARAFAALFAIEKVSRVAPSGISVPGLS